MNQVIDFNGTPIDIPNSLIYRSLDNNAAILQNRLDR